MFFAWACRLSQGDNDMEWKFARTELYMEHIQDICTVPPPFNLIPTPRGVYSFCKGVLSLCPCRRSSNLAQGAKKGDFVKAKYIPHNNGTPSSEKSYVNFGFHVPVNIFICYISVSLNVFWASIWERF